MWTKIVLVSALFCLVKSDYCLKNDCSPRTFEVKIKKSKNFDYTETLQEVEENELKDRCWQFTWLGPIDDRTNKTTSCDTSPENANVPCFEPIVWTNGTYKMNQPNTTDLAEKCKAGQTLQNTVISV